ncbi:hypothetical protein PTKIN_Ptkin14bG0117300 [Pterospermum kingtungense]
MPTSHKSSVDLDRAALLYCLCGEKIVNLGAVIHNSIYDVLKRHTSRGMPHSSLITGLCRKADVKWDSKEDLMPVKAAIQCNKPRKTQDTAATLKML